MNQALQNSILASAIAGTTLLFVLLAAGANAHEPGITSDWTQISQPDTAADRSHRMSAAAGMGLVYLAQAMGSGVPTGATAKAIARASARFVSSALGAAKAVLDGHLNQLRHTSAASHDDPTETAPPSARVRSSLAMPYFATARGPRPEIPGEAP